MADVNFYQVSSHGSLAVGSRYHTAGAGHRPSENDLAIHPNLLYAIPYISAAGGMADRMGLQVGIANGSYAQMGIYAVSCLTTLLPAGLVLGGGSVSAGAATIGATGTRDFSIQFSFQPGALYWFGVLANGSASVERIDRDYSWPILGVETTSYFLPRTMLVASYAFAALPTTFPTSATFVCTNAIAVGIRFARRF